MAKGDPKDEYLDVSINQRQFMTLRFAQLTVFLAITGVLINNLYTIPSHYRAMPMWY